MQHHTSKQREDETNTADDSRQAASHHPVTHSDPGDENKEGGMDVDINTGEAGNFPGPFHISLTPVPIYFCCLRNSLVFQYLWRLRFREVGGTDNLIA